MIGYGTNDLEEMPESKRISAKRIIINSIYNAKSPSSKGDIALIELEQSVNLSSAVKPACLMKNLDQLNEILVEEPDTIFTGNY